MNPYLGLAEDLRGQHWRDRAPCASTDPEIFFPDKGGSPRQAKRVCEHCPVRWECLAHALGRRERYGVWGGFTTEERIAMEPKRAKTTAQADHGTRAAYKSGCRCAHCVAVHREYEHLRYVRRTGGAA